MPLDIPRILSELDTEITRLQGIRAALTGKAALKKRGRPAGSKNAATDSAPKKRTMSPEARKRIGDAARKRWASQKKGVPQ